MDKNICHFIPYHKDYHTIHTVNFVMETEPQPKLPLHTEALYKMQLVVSGEGVLHMRGRQMPLRKGDLFFTFPGTPFCIESGENFTYMYVSYLGARGNRILEMLGITANQCVFHDCDAVADFWQEGLCANAEVMDLMSESILLYTFTFLGGRLLAPQATVERGDRTVLLIKKYIDEHFFDTELSLESISKALGYHKKYISCIFKKQMHIGVVEYVNTLRTQNACTMIRQGGATCVSDIAYACGFRDAQYFSKVFKNKIGMSPMEYIKKEKENEN